MAKKNKAEGITSLIRDAGRRAKEASGNSVSINSAGFQVSDPRIFSILDYIEQPWGLDFTLYPVQRFIVKLYYHIPLDRVNKTITIKDMFGEKVKYHFTEHEYLQYLYSENRCNIAEQDHPRRELILPIGRRSGKTTLSGIFASYELYRILSLQNPQRYYGLPDGNRIQLISVAVDKEQAGILFNEVTNHLNTCDFFKPFIANNTQQFVNIRTPNDIERYGPVKRNDIGTSLAGKSSIKVTFKSCIAKGLRGPGNIVIIMDEMAHYVDEGQSSAKAIYDSITPASAAFSRKNPNNSMESIGDVESRIISISSPLNKAGQFYDLYQLAMKGGEAAQNMLAIQAPTWEVNPTLPSSYYRQKYQADADVFMVEHGARFSDRIRGWIEREEDLLLCIVPDRVPHISGIPRYPYQMGIDLAMVGDATAIFITHVDGDKIVLDYHETWQAGVSWYESNPHLSDPCCAYAKGLADCDRLEFEEIADWIERLTKRFLISAGMFDRWNGIPLEQALKKRGLNQFKSEHFTTDYSSNIYQNAKMMMYDHKLELYDYIIPSKQKAEDDGRVSRSPFIKELLQLEAQQRSKNLVVVEAPKRKGNHDDMSDAFVRAVWLSTQELGKTKNVGSNRGLRNPARVGVNHVNPRAYQMRRARSHGLFLERSNRGPKR